MPAFQNFTADRMSLVTPPNSNGWNIPLKSHLHLFFVSKAIYINIGRLPYPMCTIHTQQHPQVICNSWCHKHHDHRILYTASWVPSLSSCHHIGETCFITITVTVIVIMPSLHHAQQADWYNNHKWKGMWYVMSTYVGTNYTKKFNFFAIFKGTWQRDRLFDFLVVV